ncbi:hypothetical protein D2E64_21260 [Mycobacteroides abscessus]|nr:hypothetical protein DDJ61_22030 [Mycobacteroides abscessus]PVA34356.1 hypothetical protein DDJ98_16265 [Mycobacteroides abscessus]PVA74694.1 hypothetical protein DDJ76_20500 [Mycobacteroides abscessus]PVB15705.1 hypothetical protein DDJ68_12405 [Mycobacteroides abscessus]RIR03386.1 hypothetical protein D2E35_03240 [Mycobacteroides abscessus]
MRAESGLAADPRRHLTHTAPGARAMPTIVGLSAVLMLIAVTLWATGGNDSTSYYQREVMRAMRTQSRQEKNHLAARAHRHRLRRWASRLGAVFTRRNKRHH